MTLMLTLNLFDLSLSTLTCLTAVAGAAGGTDAAELGDLVDARAAVGTRTGGALVDV